MLASKLFALLDSIYPSAPTNEATNHYSDDNDGALHDALLMAEEVVASSPPLRASLNNAASASPLYEVRPVPGKGLGLIASHCIAPGALILSESPLIKLPVSELGYHRLEWEGNRLNEFDKASFYSLHHTGMDELPSILEIWRKNSFSTSTGSNNDTQGVFKIISRINNSCSPNCSVSWDEKNNIMNVYAVQDIKEGEEITVCYVNLLLGRNIRHELLYEQWEFDCRCAACANLSSNEMRESDERRRRIAWISNELDYGYSDTSHAFNLIQEGLKLVEEEHLPTERLSLSWFGYQYSTLHQRMEEAKYYASLAYDHSKLMNGEEHNVTLLARRGLVEPVFYKSQLGGRGDSSLLGGCLVS